MQDDCLCVTYAKSKGVKAPLGMDAHDFKPNTTPHVGALALFTYKNGISHVARVVEIREDGFLLDQDGVSRCNNPSDFVAWDDKNLRGFWSSASP